jgi:hypothetical protein
MDVVGMRGGRGGEVAAAVFSALAEEARRRGWKGGAAAVSMGTTHVGWGIECG